MAASFFRSDRVSRKNSGKKKFLVIGAILYLVTSYLFINLLNYYGCTQIFSSVLNRDQEMNTQTSSDYYTAVKDLFISLENKLLSAYEQPLHMLMPFSIYNQHYYYDGQGSAYNPYDADAIAYWTENQEPLYVSIPADQISHILDYYTTEEDNIEYFAYSPAQPSVAPITNIDLDTLTLKRPAVSENSGLSPSLVFVSGETESPISEQKTEMDLTTDPSLLFKRLQQKFMQNSGTEYRTILVYEGNEFRRYDYNKQTDSWIWSDDPGTAYVHEGSYYPRGREALSYEGMYFTDPKYYGTTSIILAVKMDLAPGNLYNLEQEYLNGRIPSGQELAAFLFAVGMLSILIVAVGMVAYGFSARRELDAAIASLGRHVLVEWKILLSLLFLYGMGTWMLYDMLALLFLLPAFLIFCYLLYRDIRLNGTGAFFTNTFFHWCRAQYQHFERKYPFQKRIKHQFFFTLVCVPCLLFIWVCGALFIDDIFILLFWSIIFGFLIFQTLRNFYRTLGRFCNDIGKVTEHIEDAEKGHLQERILFPDTSCMYEASIHINNLLSSLSQQVEERIKSERMKVELITNVSHDLKTPLTAMINYVNLLKCEKLTPDYANDYVLILEQKIQRLKSMVEDLFDIAKANSGNMEVYLERLNLCEILTQSLAESEDEILKAALEFKLNFPKERVYVKADSRKLWRVIQNLIGNVVKYSLKGTRVYVDITEASGYAFLTIKNISNYEMTFSAEEITERFKRGDNARSGEGSGLGLSIVKSFTEIQNGRFSVQIDGDLFKAVLELPLMPPEPAEDRNPEPPLQTLLPENISSNRDPEKTVFSGTAETAKGSAENESS